MFFRWDSESDKMDSLGGVEKIKPTINLENKKSNYINIHIETTKQKN